MFVPKKYRSEDFINNKSNKLEAQIQKETEQLLFGSGKAFVTFDSMATTQLVLGNYSLTNTSFWKKLWGKFLFNCKNLRDECRGNKSQSVAPHLISSTFSKFNDEEEVKKLNKRSLIYFCKPLPDPVDLLWVNLNVSSQSTILRRLGLNIIAVVIVIFLTTPTSLMDALNITSLLKLITNKMDDTEVSSVFKQNLAPFLISLINLLLLLLIDYAAYYEFNIFISKMHKSILNRCSVYLMLNSLIMPLFALSTVNSIYQALKAEKDYFENVMRLIFFVDYGQFFCILIVTQGTFSFIFNLLRITELLFSSLSPWLAHYRRTQLLYDAKWRRRESDLFQYGYFYAAMLTVLAIVMVFSTTVPLIHYAGLVYFCLRHFVDALNILSLHREEMSSSGRLPSLVIAWSCFTCCLFQFLMFVSFISHRMIESASFAAILLIGSIFISIRISNEIYDDLAIEEVENDVNMNFSEQDIRAWRNVYRHPLVVEHKERRPVEE